MAYLRDALFLCFMSLCWAQATNLCEVACVQDLFKENCGGVTCVFDTPTQEALNGLCSPRCRHAITGDDLQQCLLEAQYLPMDQQTVQKDIAGLVHTHCTSFGFGLIVDERLFQIKGPKIRAISLSAEGFPDELNE